MVKFMNLTIKLGAVVRGSLAKTQLLLRGSLAVRLLVSALLCLAATASLHGPVTRRSTSSILRAVPRSRCATMRGGEGDTAKLIAETEEFVRKEIAACDASHDWGHVDRVRRGALKIAALERLADAGGDVLVVELAALMHDVRDYKYSGSDVAGVDAARAFLAERGVPDATVAAVCHVIEHVGFQKEKKECGGAFPAGEAPLGPPTELACVQDADRLDAIGAVGIARCLTFGGARSRALYDPDAPLSDPDAPMFQEGKATTLNHFHEKLLLLPELMKTKTGREMAGPRRAAMVAFLETFQREALDDFESRL